MEAVTRSETPFTVISHDAPETEKATYTPGPWRVFNGRSIHAPNHALGNPSSAVAFAITGTKEFFPEIEANARLIAAAPEMLDALVEIIVSLQITCGDFLVVNPSGKESTIEAAFAKEFEKANDAINKATGHNPDTLTTSEDEADHRQEQEAANAPRCETCHAPCTDDDARFVRSSLRGTDDFAEDTLYWCETCRESEGDARR